jgi:hypothetical protein
VNREKAVTNVPGAKKRLKMNRIEDRIDDGQRWGECMNRIERVWRRVISYAFLAS